MKHSGIIILAAGAAMIVSCKANTNNKPVETTQDKAVTEAFKTVLANDVLSVIDDLAESYAKGSESTDLGSAFIKGMTPEQLLVKPDYLLDPEEVKDLLTSSQKVNALAILISEKPVRQAYGLSTGAVDEAIARMLAETDLPIYATQLGSGSASQAVRKSYQKCKDNGTLPLFWKFNLSFQSSLMYLVSRNPEPFFNSITEEQYNSLYGRYIDCLNAARALAAYDTEIAAALSIYDRVESFTDDQASFETFEGGKRIFCESQSFKDYCQEVRNRLLD